MPDTLPDRADLAQQIKALAEQVRAKNTSLKYGIVPLDMLDQILTALSEAERMREAGRIAGMEQAATIVDRFHVGLRALNSFGRSSISTARKIAEEVRAAIGGEQP